MSRRSPLAPGAVLGNRYRLLSELGRGAMGIVWRAEHLALERQVALKVLPPAAIDDAEMVARLRREALAVARLAHPNAVAALDFGSEEGFAYLVMELVEGGSLADLLAREGKLAAPRAIGLAWQLADVLRAAHSIPIVHRDLKPANVLLAASAHGEIAKLIDFGLATFREHQGDWQRQTAAGLVVGTPAYMAPEQLLTGNAPSPAADVYALGITLFEMLTGTPPFSAPTVAALAFEHLHKPPPSLRGTLPDGALVTALDALLAGMLAKDPALRLRDGGEVLRALDALPDAKDEGPSLLADEEGVLVAAGPAASFDAVPDDFTRLLDGLGASLAQRIGREQLLVVPHAEAALRLAVALTDRAALRVGVHHGTFERLGATIYGEPVRAALRLARAARPGEILLSEEVHDAVGYGWLARVEPSGRLHFRDGPVPFEVFRIRESAPASLPVRAAVPTAGGLAFTCICGRPGLARLAELPEGEIRVHCDACSQQLTLVPEPRESPPQTLGPLLSHALVVPPRTHDEALLAALADED